MTEAWEIAGLFSRSMFVYLWCLTAWQAEGRGVEGPAFLSRDSAPLPFIKCHYHCVSEKLAWLRSDFPSTDAMHMDVLVITFIHPPARREELGQ